jgi:hypothetical protein
MDGNEALREIRRLTGRDPETGLDIQAEKIRADQERVTKILATLADSQNDRINFRINSVIKEEFERLCNARSSTLSREIKRFMVESIRKQKLL